MARPGLQKHPKFRRLVHILKEPVPHVWGYLECLWEVAYECGNPLIGDATDVELAAQYPGQPGALCQALFEARLLDRLDDGRYQIHDLLENAPDYVKRRFQRELLRKTKGLSLSDVRRQAAESRWAQASDANGCNCPPLASTQDANGATPAPAPSEDAYASSSPDKPARGEIEKPPPHGSGGSGAPEEPLANLAASDPMRGTGEPHADLQPANAEKPERSRKPKARREPNALWDAVVQVTCSDSRTSSTYIGRVCAVLREADPPYTPAEVLSLAPLLQDRGFTLPLTLGTVEKYIGWTRTRPAPARASTADAQERILRERAEFARLEKLRLESQRKEQTNGRPRGAATS